LMHGSSFSANRMGVIFLTSAGFIFFSDVEMAKTGTSARPATPPQKSGFAFDFSLA